MYVAFRRLSSYIVGVATRSATHVFAIRAKGGTPAHPWLKKSCIGFLSCLSRYPILPSRPADSSFDSLPLECPQKSRPLRHEHIEKLASNPSTESGTLCWRKCLVYHRLSDSVIQNRKLSFLMQRISIQPAGPAWFTPYVIILTYCNKTAQELSQSGSPKEQQRPFFREAMRGTRIVDR